MLTKKVEGTIGNKKFDPGGAQSIFQNQKSPKILKKILTNFYKKSPYMKM